MKRTIVLLLLALLLAPAVLGQDGSNVRVLSDPSGAKVVLKGSANNVSGVTPVAFRHKLAGNYKLKITKPGYEAYRKSISLDPTQPTEISASLSRKTRLKAAMRSAVIPGWGTIYSEHKTRGWLYFSSAAASGLTFLVLDNRYYSKRDDFHAIQDRYAASPDSIRQILRPELESTLKDVHDYEDAREVMMMVTGGIWALSLLDAMIFPARAEPPLESKSIAIRPEFGIDNVRLTVALGF